MCLIGFSQSNIRLNNYWENTYYINPASISSGYQYLASGAARRQWMGFPGAPDTEFLAFVARMYTNKTQDTQIGQIGFKLYHDLIGYTNLTSVSPSYSYSLRMVNNWRVNFGVAYKIQSYFYDTSKATVDVTGDPLIRASEVTWTGHNADVGIELVANSFLLGAVSQNLMSFFSDENNMQTNANLLYGMYRTNLDGFFDMLFGICAIKNETLYQTEFNVSGMLDSRNMPDIQLGILYRTKKEVGVLFGIDLVPTVRLACSYDYHVGDISHSSYGTPEILLTWKFDKLGNCECEDLFK